MIRQIDIDAAKRDGRAASGGNYITFTNVPAYLKVAPPEVIRAYLNEVFIFTDPEYCFCYCEHESYGNDVVKLLSKLSLTYFLVPFVNEGVFRGYCVTKVHYLGG